MSEKDNKQLFLEREEQANMLVETKYKTILESEVHYTSPVEDKFKGKTALLMENMFDNEKDVILGESLANTADGTFFKEKMPAIFRETMSYSDIYNLVSMQPISSPKSQIFAIRAYYAGTGQADGTTAGSLLTSQDRGETDASFRSSVILVSASTAQYDSITVGTSYIIAAGGAGGNLAKVLAKEQHSVNVNAKLLVELEDGKALPSIGDVYISGPEVDIAMTHIWDNEIGRRLILSKFAGPYTTAIGEGTTANELKISLESIDVKAESYYLGFRITEEFIEDFRATTSNSALKEFNTAIGWQLAMAKNRRIWNLMTSSAEYSTTWSYDTANGRMESEKIISFRNKVNYEKNRIAEKSNIGIGNFIVVTAKVFSMIESSNQYTDQSNGKGQAGFVKMGSWNNCDVYLNTLDVYTEDYFLVGHASGNLNYGCGVAPYIPLQISTAASDTDKPFVKAYAFRSREAFFKNPMGADRFMTYCTILMNGNSSWK